MSKLEVKISDINIEFNGYFKYGLKEIYSLEDFRELLSELKISEKGLGLTGVLDVNDCLVGIITDGDIKRIAQKFSDFESLELKKVMKKNPISVNENTLATSALSLMNSKKITSLCVHKKNKMNRTIGLVHMHDILNSNIN